MAVDCWHSQLAQSAHPAESLASAYLLGVVLDYSAQCLNALLTVAIPQG